MLAEACWTQSLGVMGSHGMFQRRDTEKLNFEGKNLGVDIECTAGEGWLKGAQLRMSYNHPRVILQVPPRQHS